MSVYEKIYKKKSKINNLALTKYHMNQNLGKLDRILRFTLAV